MPGDVEVQDPPTAMADYEEAMEYTEGDRRGREEIHRSDGFAVIAKKADEKKHRTPAITYREPRSQRCTERQSETRARVRQAGR